jgi:CheY-like chemotaxis protein
MTDEIVSLRILMVSDSAGEREILRSGAAMAPIPVDVVEADGRATAVGPLQGGDIDLVLIDHALSDAEKATVVQTAKSVAKPPIVVLLTPTGIVPSAGAQPDGFAVKPVTAGAAEAFILRCLRLRLPSQVLVVDDSSTMRTIIRKILSASRFPLEITEAEEGIAALKHIATGRFDFVMLDYNMPGLNGIETLSEIKRQQPKIEVVMVTSTPEDEIAQKARIAGAAAFLKKPFFPADIDTVLFRMCGIKTLAAPH